MIKASIKLYEEPKPAYAGVITSAATEMEVLEAIIDAKEVVKVGDRFRYKHNPQNTLIIIGFEENPAKVSFYKGEVCPIILENEKNKAVHKFALIELFETYMEPIEEPELGSC